MPLLIRPAGPDDADLLATLIRELAVYERLEGEARPNAAALRSHLGDGAQPRAGAFVAEVDGAPAGFALFFPTYSTFLTRWNLYLEDLYVRPEYRGQGVGLALLRAVAARAVAADAGRLEWAVLDWNDLALGFYDRLGAERRDDWRLMRLAGEALHRLATGA